MKQAKILIADDEAAITTGLSAILEDAGYGVEVVADGQKALDKLSVDRYGVVLADLKMPKLDGLTLLSELQLRQIPTECIIITGQATVDSGGWTAEMRIPFSQLRFNATDVQTWGLNIDRWNPAT